MELRLDGKRAVVTGGASGIGRAIATEFAQSGAEVVILDLVEETAESAALNIAASAGAKLSAVACDVSSEDSVHYAFAQIDAGGPIDILANSAGVAHIGSVLNTTPADFDRLFRVNVRGTYLCMAAAAQRMTQRESGVIVNMASIAGTTGLNDRFAYSMTKGAVIAMTLSAAKDLLPHNIRCNCISPARVHTPFVDGFLAKNYPGREQEMFATLSAAQPVGRMGRPDEIAALALYLASDAASFITGMDYPIDGGYMNLR